MKKNIVFVCVFVTVACMLYLLWRIVGPSITGLANNSYSPSTRDVYIYKISDEKGTLVKVMELEALPIHSMILADAEGNITSGSFKASIDDPKIVTALRKVRGDELVRLYCTHRYIKGFDSAEHVVDGFELLDNILPRDRDKKSIGFIPEKEEDKNE